MRKQFILATEDDSVDTGLETDQVIATDPVDTPEEDDGVILIPDPAELAVTKVADKEKIISDQLETNDELEAAAIPEEERQVAVTDALEVTDDLSTAIEAFVKDIKKRGYIEESTAIVARAQLNRGRKAVGLVPLNNVSLEDFGSITKKNAASKLILETFMETVDRIWKSVMEHIKKIIQWIKNLFVKFFFNVQKDIDSLNKYKDAIIKLRKANPAILADEFEKRKKDDTKSNADMARGKSVENYVQSVEIKSKLNINGKVPSAVEIGKNDDKSSFLIEMNRVHTLSTCYKAVINKYNKQFNDDFKITVGSILKEPVGIPMPNISYSPIDFFLFNESEVKLNDLNSYLMNDKTIAFRGTTAETGFTFIMTKPMMGNFTVAVKAPIPIADVLLTKGTDTETAFAAAIQGYGFDKEPRKQLFCYTKWDILSGSLDTGSVNDGWLPWLSAKEMTDVTEVAIKALRNIEFLEDNSNKFTGTLDALKATAEFCAISCKSMGDSINDPTSVNSTRAKDINLIVECINGMIRATNNAVSKYSPYIRTTTSAWGLYLKEIYNYEYSLVYPNKVAGF